MIQGSKIEIHFNCEREKVFCEKAEKVFQRVNHRIESVIEFHAPIRVNLSLFLPCGEKKLNRSSLCPHMSTLGFAAPVRSYPIYRPELEYSLDYPQSLLRDLTERAKLISNQSQVEPFLSSSMAIQYDSFDILARYNSLFNWWFSVDDKPIKSDQYDLEMIALHEFLHGLGFGSINLIATPEEQLLLPLPELNTERNLFQRWRPPTLFESLLWVQSDSSKTFKFPSKSRETQFPYAVPIESNLIPLTFHTIAMRHITQTRFEKGEILIPEIESFVMKPPMNDISNLLYKLATTNDTLAVSSMINGRKSEGLILETGLKPFSGGSSLGHISFDHYINSPEFLMVYSQINGISLDLLIVQNKAPATGIGPLTSGILQAMGYQLIKNSKDSRKALTGIFDLPNGAYVLNEPSLPLIEENPSPKYDTSSDSPSNSSLLVIDKYLRWWLVISIITAHVF